MAGAKRVPIMAGGMQNKQKRDKHTHKSSIIISSYMSLCGNVRIEVCAVFWPQSPGPVSLRIPNHPHPPPLETNIQIFPDMLQYLLTSLNICA